MMSSNPAIMVAVEANVSAVMQETHQVPIWHSKANGNGKMGWLNHQPVLHICQRRNSCHALAGMSWRDKEDIDIWLQHGTRRGEWDDSPVSEATMEQHLGVSIIIGVSLYCWMVDFMQNPSYKWMMTGGIPMPWKLPSSII